jgi:hypothetical protein
MHHIALPAYVTKVDSSHAEALIQARGIDGKIKHCKEELKWYARCLLAINTPTPLLLSKMPPSPSTATWPHKDN